MYCVLQSTTLYYKVLLRPKRRRPSSTILRTTKYDSRTTPYYKVLLQYYSVLQSTALYYKVLLRPKRRPSSTTPYYKVLLQYYSLLQTYYSSTTPYYKVLLQLYCVLQSTTPNYKLTTKYYSSTTPYYKLLLCTTKDYSHRNDVRTTSIQYYSVYYKVLLQYYFVLQSTTPYYKVLLQYYSVLQSTTPVLLRTTKYYSVLQPYYKVLFQYYSVLQSTTLYYKVLLRTTNLLQSTIPELLRTTKNYSVLQSTTPTETTSERRPSSTTPYYKAHSNTPPYYKVLLQYYSSTTPVLLCTTNVLQSTLQYSSVLQSTTPVLLCTTKYYSDRNDVRTTSIQYYSVLQSTTPVLLRTTKYYSVLQSTTPYYKVLQSTTPVLLRTTKYYSSTTPYYSVLQSTTPVLLRTTKYYSSTTPILLPTTNVLLQYYSVLQSNTKASKTSVSCEASSTFHHNLLQNEHFVRGFLNFSSNKLPKGAFRARLPQLFKEQASKTSISCEASSTFHYNLLPKRAFRARRPQLFKEQASKRSISCEASSTFHYNLLPKRAFRARRPQLFKQQASKRSISYEASSTFQRTRFQNEHFVRDSCNFSSKELPKSCACHAKRENDLSPWKFAAPKRAFRARLMQLFKQGASKVLRLPRKTRKWPLTLKVCSAKTSISCETSFTFHTFNLKIDDFVRVFLIKPFSQSSKSMTFAKLPPLFKTITKSCACHDICSNVTFGRHCHCDSWKQHLRHVTKCCACHDIAKGHITKCCACHEKTTRLHWHTAKVLRLSRKTRKWPHILWLGSAKTSISCETSSTFHTLKDRMVSQCECTAQWRRINELATTRRRRHDDEATTRRRRGSKTKRTQVQPQTPTINGNPSLRIREKKHLVVWVVKGVTLW